MGLLNNHSSIGGKISIFTALLGVVVILLGLVVELPHNRIASANTATTSVTVLNTPPTWSVDAQESPASSTSTPTNSGNTVTWVATALDSSNDNYHLIICKTSVMPTPVPSGAPTCNGGIGNQWAISASTASGSQATAATTTYNADPMEFGHWYAWICDRAPVSPACNSTYKQGNGDAASPFVVNHRPTFTWFYTDSPKNPGQTVSWFATATDQDTYEGTATDTITLFVCRLNDFTGTSCGPGGQWANSTTSYAGNGATTSNPVASSTLGNPYPDANYPSYGFIVDTHGGHVAVGGAQGMNPGMTVNNMAPTIAAASISLLDVDGSGPLILTGMATQTAGFRVQYTVSDDNSCQTASGTPEIISSLVNVYRSGITQTGCDTAGEYNPNYCYPGAVGGATWQVNCVASTTAPCQGTGDPDIVWQCTFPLWYLTQSTDGTGNPTDPPWWAENWLASAQAGDNNSASSALVESAAGNELNSYLAYDLSTSTIVYGSLQPGDSVDPIGPNANMRVGLLAVGNVGLDETLYGNDMCPSYPTCSGLPASTIFTPSQKYATSSLSYAAATALAYNPGVLFPIHVPKSIATATPTSTDTYWGINVPGVITVSGDYTGVNTLIGATSPSAYWSW